MTVLSDLGIYFIVGLSGPSLSDLDRKILSELRPSGVLLLKRNFLQDVSYNEWLGALRTLEDDVVKLTGRKKLFISIDHEGDRVHRTPAPITHFPAACLYASASRNVGEAMGRELASLGINVSWAPVADIHSNPANPVIGKRAFASSPEEVTRAALDYARGLQAAGVLSCAKHFPGHGDTSVDSHLSLPTLDATLDDLMKRELLPFCALMREGVPFIMTSHILFPKIDPDFPATLSRKILTEVLRDRLGFDGVVVTDDLDMKAIAERFSPEETAGRAMTAGCDLFLVARYPDGTSDKPLILAEQLRSAYEKGLVSREILAASKTRIEKALELVTMHPVTTLSEESLKTHQALAKACVEQN